MGTIKSGDADAKIKLMAGDAKVKRAYAGDVKIYSSGNTVTYHIDSGVSYQEEVDEGASCLSPKSFTPAKSGWEFVGWRQDTEANGSVLSSLAMGDEPITLYAVFRQAITLSYNGNSATSGSTAAQTGARYYNNGNVTNPSFILRANGFAKTDYAFSKWALGSAGGTQYAAGTSVTLSANTTMYAVWVAAPFTLVLNANDSGWIGPNIAQGSFANNGPALRNYWGGGVEVCGIGNSVGWAVGNFYKTINTRGLQKADITVGNADGGVTIGSSRYNFDGKSNTTVTISLGTSESQTIIISVNNGGDTYNVKSMSVIKIYFHN